MGYTLEIDGQKVEINDTLAISRFEGFPRDLNYSSFRGDPREVAERFLGYKGSFMKEDYRQFPKDNTPAFLVEKNDEGRWLYWGRVLILDQTRNKLRTGFGSEKSNTRGTYVISQIFDITTQKILTVELSPQGKSFFNDSAKSFRLNK